MHRHALQVRCAGAVWLVSLVLYTRGQAPLMRQLPTIQDSLSHVRACMGNTSDSGRTRLWTSIRSEASQAQSALCAEASSPFPGFTQLVNPGRPCSCWVMPTS